MLSRVADSLYWLSRYIERAENLVRLVAVNERHALDTHSADAAGVWRPVLYATGNEDGYAATDGSGVGHFLLFSASNPDSVRNCIASARENARMVRDQISEEMWLDLNTIHLYLGSDRAERDFADDPQQVLRRILRFSLLFQGLTDSTILHDEGWHFIKLGKFIERADATSRILDTLTFDGGADPGRPEFVAVLRSCSGFSAFRSETRGDVTPRTVTSFLLFSGSFPRSVRFCLRQLDDTLHALSGVPAGTFSNEAERITGSTLAHINFASIDDVFATGLHGWIDGFQQKLNAIGQNLFETYVLLPFEIDNVTRTEGLQFHWQQQQQQQQ